MSHINLVHRKLLYLYFFLLACTFLFSQIPNGITTSEGNQSNLSICDGDLVTFTLDPVSGFVRVKFTVYDNFGNILYTESIEEPNPDFPQGIKLNGWDGYNATSSTSYIYRFEGFTFNEEDPIIRSGTFILLR